MHTSVFLSCVAICAALVGCAPSTSPSTVPGVAVGVVVMPAPGATPRSAALQCNGTPVGTGYLSSAEQAKAACDAVRAHEDLLVTGPPKDRICTQQYGGPETARVAGRINGKTVNATFSRTDGCRIADWEKMKALLGPPNSGSASPTPA